MSRILYQFQMVSQTNKCFYVLTKDAGAISQDSMYPPHNPITAQLSLSSFPRIRAWNRDSRCLQWRRSALRRRGKNTLEQEKAKKCWRTRSETELALVSWARNSGAKTELPLVVPWGKGTSLFASLCQPLSVEAWFGETRVAPRKDALIRQSNRGQPGAVAADPCSIHQGADGERGQCQEHSLYTLCPPKKPLCPHLLRP